MSYQFAAKLESELRAIPWDVVVIDEAHKLRNATNCMRTALPEVLALLGDVKLEDRLRAELPGRVHVNGHPRLRLPNTSNVSVDGLQVQAVFTGIAASAGSACHAGETTPSPVLVAMGLPTDRAHTAVRFSFGRWSTESDVHRAVAAVVAAA